MANGVLGLGSGQASALNSELIEKLKTAERVSTVAPIETKITKIATEKETFSTIDTKVKELLDAIKPFDLFVSGGVTAFEQKSATTSGDSVTFDAADVKALQKGFTTVNVSQLAQKDVYQSNSVTSAVKDTVINKGILTIKVDNVTENFDTANMTYEQLATAINSKSKMAASVEQVGTNSFRLVIKSEESGLDNKLQITGTASDDLGYTTDGTDPKEKGTEFKFNEKVKIVPSENMVLNLYVSDGENEVRNSYYYKKGKEPKQILNFNEIRMYEIMVEAFQ